MDLQGKNILVTGGAGFIGSHLVDRLITEKPGKICVIDSLFLGKEANLRDAMNASKTVKLYKQDASDRVVLSDLIEREAIDVVYDLATIPLPTSMERPEFAFNTNINIAMNLVELQRRDKFKTLIHFSSSEAYGSAMYYPMDENHPFNPTTPYGASKAAADVLLTSYYKLFGLDLAIMRPFNNFGPRQNEGAYAGIIPITIKRILDGQSPMINGDGKQTREFIYVKDTAEACVRVYNEPKTRGQIINVARGKEYTVEFIIATISKVMGYAGKPSYGPPRVPDVRRHIASNKLCAELLNWTPQTTLEDGMKETVTWYTNFFSNRK